MSEFRRILLMAMNKAEPPITKDYLTIVALEDGLTAKLSLNACEYCVDGDGNWKTLPADTETESINNGQTLSFRGNLTPTSNNGIGTFTVNKFHNLKGNCMSMLFGDDAKDYFSLSGKDNAFNCLFINNINLIKALELDLPATTLSKQCYSYMFSGCYNLTTSPALNSVTSALGCYSGMFFRCYNLLAAPTLPAKSISWNGYNNMFDGCNKLNFVKALFTITPDNNITNNWLKDVAPTGVFVKGKDATWDVVGVNGIPEGWTVITE